SAAYSAPVAVHPMTGTVGYSQTPQIRQFQLNASAPGTQPAQYQGVWRCVSQVTASNVNAIAPGRAMECLLQFKLTNGQLFVSWDESGWNPADCSVVNFTPRESSIVHKSMSMRDPNWAALSHDRLRMLSSNLMEGRSRVVQYQAGRLIGVYETVSNLTRVQ